MGFESILPKDIIGGVEEAASGIWRQAVHEAYDLLPAAKNLLKIPNPAVILASIAIGEALFPQSVASPQTEEQAIKEWKAAHPEAAAPKHRKAEASSDSKSDTAASQTVPTEQEQKLREQEGVSGNAERTGIGKYRVRQGQTLVAEDGAVVEVDTQDGGRVVAKDGSAVIVKSGKAGGLVIAEAGSQVHVEKGDRHDEGVTVRAQPGAKVTVEAPAASPKPEREAWRDAGISGRLPSRHGPDGYKNFKKW